VTDTASSNAGSDDTRRPGRGWSEDWLAVAIGWVLLLFSFAAVTTRTGPGDDGQDKITAVNRVGDWFGKTGDWVDSPLEALKSKKGDWLWPGLLGSGAACLLMFGAGAKLNGQSFRGFAPAFAVLFILALLAYLLAGHKVIKALNLEYAMWALVMGLVISNTIGTARWMRPALRTELYIKTGLVLLGAEILMGRLMALGLPGIFVAWIVTPIVLIVTFWFGQRILKISSPSLNMVISADMSVCGVSAAIATAAACRAKKEELSLAIGLSLSFTVVMMVLMPMAIKSMGIDNILGGAWMGGTIDATGAVAAAGAMLGPDALEVAATVKMIQNILIGVIAFGVAVYWVTYVEKREGAGRPSIGEIWVRFPKFILGFIAASIVFSMIQGMTESGTVVVDAMIDGVTKTMRGWSFCLAFVSIGLETNFRELAKQMAGGKPLVLYVCGQTLNLVLTLAMAWLMFKVVFPDAAQVIAK